MAERLKASLRRPAPESRAVLRGFILRIIAERKRATIYYTFPIEDGAAGPGGSLLFYGPYVSPVGAPTERKISVHWTLRPETKKARNEEIRARRRAGATHRELAQAFGISIQRVGQISHKNHPEKYNK